MSFVFCSLGRLTKARVRFLWPGPEQHTPMDLIQGADDPRPPVTNEDVKADLPMTREKSTAQCALLWLCGGIYAVAQVGSGMLQIHVTDPQGRSAAGTAVLASEASGYDKSFRTNKAGEIDVEQLPYGVYRLTVASPGFDTFTRLYQVHSAIPLQVAVQLSVARTTTSVRVSAAGTLIDTEAPTSVMQIGSGQIEDRVASLPGRSVQDLVNMEPGWLYEGNAVLHPRGSEYQTQFVINGIPLTDNRSPSFGPEIEADDISSMRIYTAGFPAEYGRKMGGVIAINTKQDTNPGLHSQLILNGGSYSTAGAFGQLQDTWGRNTVSGTADGSMTAHYLNPVVPQNFTNNGTTGDFSLHYDRELRQSDQFSVGVRHEFSHYQIPNEFVQQQAGQRQYGDNFETMGTVTYRHVFSPDTVGYLAGMVRDNANDLYSNPESTPIIAFQHNSFREGYFKATLEQQHRRQQWKVGVENDATILHEGFSDTITDPTQFDDGTPESFAFLESRPDLEQAAFVEDLIRLGDWTVSAGLRWDHYQLILNEQAWSPRLAVSRYLRGSQTLLHAAFDRIFQTPSSENILISSSPLVTSLDPQVLRLPVQPSRGNYYEGGVTQGIAGHARVDVNVFRRDVRNYADDDQLLNTGVSYPIAFDRAVLYGAEGKLDVVRLGKLSGFVSYSYIVGNVWFPVTGGLFLGDDVTDATTQLSGHFPDSQDQRNTLRTRFRYDVLPRIWIAAGLESGSGLPFEYEGDYATALAEYGRMVVGRINFARGRVDPSLAADASFSLQVAKRGRLASRLQIDGTNLNNRLNVIDFGGLFSGNAIAPGRSVYARLNTTF